MEGSAGETTEAAADVEQFRALFEAQWDAVERYARRRIGPDASADVAADVFAVAWRRRDDLPADPVPWLYGTARRVLANHRRSTERADNLIGRLGGVLLASSDGDYLRIDPANTVPDSLVLARAFNRLDVTDREVLALIAWDGLDARSAALVLGCRVGAFTMRLTRARRRLRSLLTEEAT